MNCAPKLEYGDKEGTDREGALINGVYCSDIYMGIIKSDYFHQ